MTDQFKQEFQRKVQTGPASSALQYAKEYLRANPREIEAWWFIATTVPNPKIQRQCCEHILKVDPTYYQAQALLDQLNEPQHSDTSLLENPLGLPGGNAPGVKPFKMIFVEDEPQDDTEKPWEKLAETPPQPLDKKRILLFSIVALMVIWGLAGAIYYFVLYNPDPSVKLNASVKNDQFTIQYPEDWQTQSFSDGRILLANRDVPNLENDAIANPWQNLAGGQMIISFFNLFVNVVYNDLLADNDKDDLVVVVMQPVPQDATDLINELVNTAQKTYDRSFITYEFDIEASTEEVVLGGVSTEMILLNTTIKEAFSVGKPQNMKLYFIPVRENNQHYLFTMMVTERGDNDWRNVVHDIAGNIRFQN